MELPSSGRWPTFVEGVRREAIPIVLVAAGLGLRLTNAFRPLDSLLRTTIPDDAFYYFGIARHLSLGHPPSIDGVSATNGFHPLWMALLVPLYWGVGSGSLEVPIHVALALGAVLDSVSAWLIYGVSRRIGMGRAPSSIGLAFFVLNPFQIVNATCGLETPLALCAALVLLSIHLGVPLSARLSPVHAGIASGLAILARTDQVLLVLALQGARTWAMGRSDGSRKAAAWAAEVTLVAALIFAPWALFSLHAVGTVVQSSGVALAYVHSQMPRVWGFEHPSSLLVFERALGSVHEGALLLCRWHGVSAGEAFALGLVALGSVVLSGRGPRRSLPLGLVPVAPWVGGMTAIFLAHTLGRAVFREWYTAPFIATSALLMAILVQHFTGLLARRGWVFGAALLCVSAWIWRAIPAFGAALYPFQGRAGAPREGLHEGHSDCGIVSYFSLEGITNLDGIVNQQALVALRGGRLLDYIEKARFERVYVTGHYHSSVFFGAHYRESLVGVEDDFRAVRAAGSEVEKNARIGPVDDEISLGAPKGREYLGDGWIWNSGRSEAAASIGGSAELVLYLPRTDRNAALDLRLSAAAVNDGGRQPVSVFLNGRQITSFDVIPATRVYTVPLGEGVSGRNRVRLDFGAPRALRNGQPDWWRTLEGNPLRAVDAHGLTLRGLTPKVLDFDVADVERVACDGCYGNEQGGGQGFRWTNGDARLRLRAPPLRALGECQLRVQALPRVPEYEVRIDGRRVEGSGGVFQLPSAGGGAANPEIEIVSGVFIPAEKGSTDTRRLGVALARLSLFCW